MTRIRLYLEYELPPVSPLKDTDVLRLEHEDLQEMSREELTTEAWRIRLTLAFGDLRCPVWAKEWLEERLDACKKSLGGRP